MVAFSERQLRVCRCSCQRRSCGSFVRSCSCVDPCAHAPTGSRSQLFRHSHPNHSPAKMAKGKGTKAKRTGAKAGKGGSISKGGVRRLARRAGVKRIRGEWYPSSVVLLAHGQRRGASVCGVCARLLSPLRKSPYAQRAGVRRGPRHAEDLPEVDHGRHRVRLRADQEAHRLGRASKTLSPGVSSPVHTRGGCAMPASVYVPHSDRLLVLPRPPTCCTP